MQSQQCRQEKKIRGVKGDETGVVMLCSFNHGANIMSLPYEITALRDLLQQVWSNVWINGCSHLQNTYCGELQARTIDGIMPKTLPQGKLRTRLRLSTEDLLKKKLNQIKRDQKKKNQSLKRS